MIEQLLEAQETESVPQLCERLGRFLELEEPVPAAVLLRAIDDPAFASDLITSRGVPEFLQALFDDPRTAAFTPAPGAAALPMTNRALVGRAAEAFVKWGKAGFSTVDAETLQRREDACLACPHLVEPQAVVQRLVPLGRDRDRVGSRTGRKVCELCGCNVGKKMRLPTESCPEAHPMRGGVSRWGE